LSPEYFITTGSTLQAVQVKDSAALLDLKSALRDFLEVATSEEMLEYLEEVRLAYGKE
jgi:hypothetical protein